MGKGFCFVGISSFRLGVKLSGAGQAVFLPCAHWLTKPMDNGHFGGILPITMLTFASCPRRMSPLADFVTGGHMKNVVWLRRFSSGVSSSPYAICYDKLAGHFFDFARLLPYLCFGGLMRALFGWYTLKNVQRACSFCVPGKELPRGRENCLFMSTQRRNIYDSPCLSLSPA